MIKPLISIAIITYNQENFISQTLDSILNQKHDFPYEIVIGEDCSTDNTKSVIEKYVKQYPDIIKPIYNNPNLGLIKNFFNVLENCSGKYIMECAGDDYWLPGKIQTQIKYMEKHPKVGMCYGKAKSFYQDKGIFSKKSFGGKKTKFDELFLGNSIPALTVCYKKELASIYINNIEPCEKDWNMEDIPMWLWFAKESKIVFLNRIFGVYRVLLESESHFLDSKKHKKYEESCYNVRKFYSEKYGEEKLLNDYCLYWNFIEAWKNKNQNDIIIYANLLPSKYKNFQFFIKKIIAKYDCLFNLLILKRKK